MSPRSTDGPALSDDTRLLKAVCSKTCGNDRLDKPRHVYIIMFTDPQLTVPELDDATAQATDRKTDGSTAERHAKSSPSGCAPSSVINGGAIIDHETSRERRFVAVQK